MGGSSAVIDTSLASVTIEASAICIGVTITTRRRARRKKAPTATRLAVTDHVLFTCRVITPRIIFTVPHGGGHLQEITEEGASELLVAVLHGILGWCQQARSRFDRTGCTGSGDGIHPPPEPTWCLRGHGLE